MGYTLGIDLGTTFTAAATASGNRTDTFSLGNHAATIPSVVFLRDDGGVIIGDVAQRRGQEQPDRIAREFKRRFGDATPIMLGHTPYSAERLMAAILSEVARQVTERNGGPPDAVAVAHPANWGPYKIELLRQAVQLAGLDSALLVTEPEAAAVHFAAGERVDVGDVVAVYDLGGGTFDAAVLRRTEAGFETLGEPQGIERLGGIDFDEAVLSHVRAVVGDAIASLDMNDPIARAAIVRLREECAAAKEALSDDSETSIQVLLPGLQTTVRMTRAELEDAIRPALRETVESLRRAITATGVPPEQLKAIVLAGGSSRIPLVRELVGELGRPVLVDAHPKHTVALGAARIAATAVSSEASLAAIAAVPPAAPQPAVTSRVASPIASPPTEPPPVAPPSGPSSTPPLDPPAGGGRSKHLLLAAAAIALMAVASVVGYLLLKPSDDDKAGPGVTTTTTEIATTPDPDPTVTTESTQTTDTTVEQTCESSSERCVFLNEISEDTSGYIIDYTTFGYQPAIDGGPDAHHIHFFFDTVAVNDAGVPGAGPWTIWDLDANGNMVFQGADAFRASNVPEGASQICAVVATNSHAVDADPRPSCIDIP